MIAQTQTNKEEEDNTTLHKKEHYKQKRLAMAPVKIRRREDVVDGFVFYKMHMALLFKLLKLLFLAFYVFYKMFKNGLGFVV